MTKEDKELLLKDLCARLPYHPRINVYNDCWEGCRTGVFDTNLYSHHIDAFICDRIEVKLYLRPMSSMTEEERSNLRAYCRTQEGIIYDIGVSGAINSPAIIDWLNKKGFDYRGLIPMGLALEAPEGMYLIY